MTEQYMPTTERVRLAASMGSGNLAVRGSEFDRWYQAEIAAAEQRGAKRGWDEAMTTQIQRLISGDPDVERFQMPANPYRADRLEGDDD